MSAFKDIIHAAGTGAKIISIFAAMASLFLLVIYLLCPLKRVHGYRSFFLLTAIQDVILALCCLFLTPVTITWDFTGVYVATGMFRFQPLGEPLLIIFANTFVFSLLIITNSFVYRYVHLCHPDLVASYSSRKWNYFIILLNILIVLNWFFMLLCGSWRDDEFLEQWSPIVLVDTGINLTETAFFGFSVKNVSAMAPFVLLCENWLILFGLLAVNCFCAIRIVVTLRKATLSKQKRKHHKQMFSLLLVQTASPTLFMYAPVGFMFTMLFSGTRSTVAMTTIAATLLSIFPLIDPIIPIVFLREYRAFILDSLYSISPVRTVAQRTVFS